MGRPRHYSGELPQRCQRLIEMLGDRVDEASDPDGRWGGPLKTTFLLAMATPMLVLPIERILKAADGAAGVADERDLDPGFAERLIAQAGAGANEAFGKAPFFKPDVWAYLPEIAPFNAAQDWPQEALAALQVQEALAAAEAAPARDVLLALRNALGHGGVAYLDRNGAQVEAATHMLGFASYARYRRPELRLLRIRVADFQDFLRDWTRWLARSGALYEMDAYGPVLDFAAE